MKRLLFSLLFLSVATIGRGQILGVKTNIPAWGYYGNINAGAELGFARQWSFSVEGAYNPFSWGGGKKTNLLAVTVQGEVRYWPRYKFARHFVGMHGHNGQYDWGG